MVAEASCIRQVISLFHLLLYFFDDEESFQSAGDGGKSLTDRPLLFKYTFFL